MTDNIPKKAGKIPGSYEYSPLPFGIVGNLALITAPFLIVFFGAFIMMGEGYVTTGKIMLCSVPFFFIVAMVGPVMYNYVSSPFQKDRKIIDSFTFGGSMSSSFMGFPGASYPYFRLILYQEGLEIRFMFCCYFIPYDKMKESKLDLGYPAIWTMPTPSELPMYIYLFSRRASRLKKIIDLINEQRDRYLAEFLNDKK